VEKANEADHPSTLGTVDNLARVFMDQGKLEEAKGLSERAFAGQEKVLRADHLSTLTTLNNLASIFNSQCKLEETKGLNEWEFTGFEKALGADRPSRKRANAFQANGPRQTRGTQRSVREDFGRI